MVFAGYLGEPDATAAVLRDGWLRTGDLGAVDAAGRLTIADRREDLVISGGENVYPAEVEAVLRGHPAILDAAVVGRPDPTWGSVPLAAIVVRPGSDPSDAELRDALPGLPRRLQGPGRVRPGRVDPPIADRQGPPSSAASGPAPMTASRLSRADPRRPAAGRAGRSRRYPRVMTQVPDTGQLSAFLQARGFPLLILLVLTLIAFRAVRPLAHRLIIRALERRTPEDTDPEVAALAVEESRKRVTTLEDLVATFLKFLVATVAVLVLLTMLDLLPVIAGLGILAAALTLAGQSIVLDFLMGVLIVLEGPYYKGDWVQIGGVEGEVEEVGLRRTVLRDSSGHRPQRLELERPDRLEPDPDLRPDAGRRHGRLRDRPRPGDRDHRPGRGRHGRRRGLERAPARDAAAPAGGRPGRARDDPAGGGQGPGGRSLGRAGRAAQAAHRRVPGQAGSRSPSAVGWSSPASPGRPTPGPPRGDRRAAARARSEPAAFERVASGPGPRRMASRRQLVEVAR